MYLSTSHLNTEEFMFSVARGNFSKTVHILGHKVTLNTYRNIKITFYILSKHYTIKMDINHTKILHKLIEAK